MSQSIAFSDSNIETVQIKASSKAEGLLEKYCCGKVKHWTTKRIHRRIELKLHETYIEVYGLQTHA